MRIVITGGAGFIGSHLCDRLVNEKHEVVCLDNLLTGSKKNISHLLDNPSFTFIQQDVTQPFNLEGKIHAIYHLASPASPNHHSKLSYHALPMETMMVNTTGTRLLLEMALKFQSRFLFASTSEVYGEPLVHPQTEDYRGNVSTTGPRSVYDESKRFGETLTSFYVRSHGLDARTARIFNTFGPRMAKGDLRMIVSFITQALEGKEITVFGDGSQTRSLCFVDDTVEGLIKLMTSDKAKGNVVNIGSPDEHSVLEYAKIVKQVTKSSSKITFSEKLPEDDPQRRKPDISKAKKLLDWEPKTKFKTGLAKMVNSYKKLLNI